MPTYDELPTIEWRDEYLISIDALDRENENLFVSLSDYIQSINSRLGAEIIRKKLVILETRFLLHFETEKNILIEFGVADFDDHQQDHQELIKRLQIIRRMRQSESVRAQELLSLFRTWVTNHLTVRDRDMGRSITGFPPGPPPPGPETVHC